MLHFKAETLSKQGFKATFRVIYALIAIDKAKQHKQWNLT
jgi:hypothetical protein